MIEHMIPEGIRPKLRQSPIAGNILSVASELEEHFKVDKYKEVLWDRTIHKGEGRAPSRGYLYCNGILVGDFSKPATGLLFNMSPFENPLYLQMPNVLVTDYDANLPLDLVRKTLATKDDELADGVMTSICEQFLSELFACPARTPSAISKWWNNEQRFITSTYWNPFLFGPNGFSLLDGNLLAAIAPEVLMVSQSFSEIIDHQISAQILKNAWFASRQYTQSGITARLDLLRDATRKFPQFRGFSANFRFCYIIEDPMAERISQMSGASNYIRSMIESRVVFRHDEAEFCVLNRSLSKKSAEAVADFARQTLAIAPYSGEWSYPAAYFELNPGMSSSAVTTISKVWNKTFSKPFLPYDPAERRLVLI